MMQANIVETADYVCPKCKVSLRVSNDQCANCGFPVEVKPTGSLLVNHEAFRDHDHEQVVLAVKTGNTRYYEKDELINRQFISKFSIPLIEKLFGARRDIRILSIGCGIGADVDILRKLGYQAWGSDCGSRCLFWPQREFPEYLSQCTDASMPFSDGFFDFVMCHQVLEHVGVVGDSMILQPDSKGVRQRFLNNLMRLVKPDGYANVATPNRTFPLDPGHAPNFMGVRVHGPFDHFLTSYDDMRGYFPKDTVTPLSPQNYYAGTFSSRAGIVGKWFTNYIRFIDRTPAIQDTFLNPLTNVLVHKTA